MNLRSGRRSNCGFENNVCGCGRIEAAIYDDVEYWWEEEGREEKVGQLYDPLGCGILWRVILGDSCVDCILTFLIVR